MQTACMHSTKMAGAPGVRAHLARRGVHLKPAQPTVRRLPPVAAVDWRRQSRGVGGDESLRQEVDFWAVLQVRTFALP